MNWAFSYMNNDKTKTIRQKELKTLMLKYFREEEPKAVEWLEKNMIKPFD